MIKKRGLFLLVIIPLFFTNTLASFSPNRMLGKELKASLLTPLDGATKSSSDVEMRAEITRGLTPVKDATVKFYVDGDYVGEDTTGVSGYASYTHSFSEGSHTWYVTAEKEGYESDTSPTRTLTIELPFDFDISVSPSSRSVSKGDSTTYDITVTLLSGTTEKVSLTATGLPSADKSFSVSSGNPSFTSVLIVDTSSSTLIGQHSITITGTSVSGLKTHTKTVDITIEEPTPQFDFSISVSTSSQTVTMGGCTSIPVTVTLLDGSAETVKLSVTGMASTAKSFSVNEGTPAYTSLLKIETNQNTPLGTHELTIKGENQDSTVVHEVSAEIEVIESITSVPPSLARTPIEVKSRHPALIFAHVPGSHSDVKLSTTITINLLKDESSLEGFPRTITAENIPLVPSAQSPGWYFTSIPGLPTKTIDAIKTWKIKSIVTYTLIVDSVEAASGSYVVKEGDIKERLPPFVATSVYDVAQDRGILNETYGLGPRGWKTGAYEKQEMLIVAVDDQEVEDVCFEYSVSDDTWQELQTTEATLMNKYSDLKDEIEQLIQYVNDLPLFPDTLAGIRETFRILTAEIPGQAPGNYVKFKARASDIDGKDASSPTGLYFVVDEDSDTRVLILDPHIKLWLLEENLENLLNRLKSSSGYQFPDQIIDNMRMVAKVSELMEKYNVVPFHHWEILGEDTNFYVTSPDEGVADLLNEFKPDVIYLSNLRLGVEEDETQQLDWDLKDITVEGKTLSEHIIEYVKENNAGVIGTHGTLSDWKVWQDPETQYKIAARGHVGENIENINPIDESTMAALLGLPEITLWEYARDSAADTLFANPDTKPFAPIVGSIPLQVSRVPFDEPLKTTIEGEDHPVLDNIPPEFEVETPSVYQEFGFKAYTQAGWQLAMPRSLAYKAWWKAEQSSSKASEIIEDTGELLENVTSGRVNQEEASRIRDSLEWGLKELYRSIISANITKDEITITLDIPELEEPITFSKQIDYEKLLQHLPVKLISLSKDGLAGIITHDKYWDSKGYRAVYFSFEPEASESETIGTLIRNAVEWSNHWERKHLTQLLGDKVRVPNEVVDRFNEVEAGLPGDVSYSDGVLLNEEGCTTIKVETSQPANLHLAVAHPSSDKVTVVVLEGEAEVTANTTIGQTTEITINVQVEGTVKLGIRADPESSLTPAYLTVKQETIEEHPQEKEALGNLRITVTDEDNDTLEEVTINSTSEPNGQPNLTSKTSTDGAVTFTDITSGSYKFKATKQGYVSETASLNVPEDETIEVTITLQEKAPTTEEEEPTQPEEEEEEKGRGIPGFPIESIIIGIVTASLIIWLIHYTRMR